MTTPETLTAAADALRAEATPLHLSLAEWLEDTARDMQERIDTWTRAYTTELASEVMEANAAVLYAYPLAVARTVLGVGA